MKKLKWISLIILMLWIIYQIGFWVILAIRAMEPYGNTQITMPLLLWYIPSMLLMTVYVALIYYMYVLEQKIKPYIEKIVRSLITLIFIGYTLTFSLILFSLNALANHHLEINIHRVFVMIPNVVLFVLVLSMWVLNAWIKRKTHI